MCPVPQVCIEPGIHADEGPFGRYRRIVVAPPPDDGVKAVDEPLLGGGASVPDFLMHLMEVCMLGGFRRLDAGGETQGDTLAGLPRFGLANRVLSDVESQEVEPCDTFDRVERMPDPRFAGLQRSPHLLQPVCRDVLSLHDGVIVAVEHDQIISESDDSGSPPVTILGGWKGGGNSRFQAMEGDVREER